MEKPGSKKALLILDILSKSEKPLGTWAITNELKRRGFDVSPATTGRLLNDLEQEGLLKKQDNNQGRTITHRGREFLSSKILEEKLTPNCQQLSELVNSNTLQKFLMVLEARKAVESATARLAAKNASADQIMELERIVNKREEAIRRSETVHKYDIEFHSLIAESSGNKILSLLYQTISVQGQQSEMFEMIRKKDAGKYESSHRAICEAIKNRDENLAEKCMINHIESLMSDVMEYGEKFFNIQQ
ncbi:MAG: FCD domain-containing protein [Spirochaetaceae bacterium]|nr:FCD domain-containing protein [Spirochaetaceae bacterium]